MSKGCPITETKRIVFRFHETILRRWLIPRDGSIMCIWIVIYLITPLPPKIHMRCISYNGWFSSDRHVVVFVGVSLRLPLFFRKRNSSWVWKPTSQTMPTKKQNLTNSQKIGGALFFRAFFFRLQKKKGGSEPYGGTLPNGPLKRPKIPRFGTSRCETLLLMLRLRPRWMLKRDDSRAVSW